MFFVIIVLLKAQASTCFELERADRVGEVPLFLLISPQPDSTRWELRSDPGDTHQKVIGHSPY